MNMRFTVIMFEQDDWENQDNVTYYVQASSVEGAVRQTYKRLRRDLEDEHGAPRPTAQVKEFWKPLFVFPGHQQNLLDRK